MTLRELIEALTAIEETYAGDPDDLEVILSSDEEGNSFSRAFEVAVQMSRADEWEVDLVHPQDWEETVELTMDDEDIDRDEAIAALREDGFKQRVVIWP